MGVKAKPSFRKKSMREMQPSVLRQSMQRKLPNRLSAKAEILLPAVPGFVDHYVQGLTGTWDSLGRHFTPSDVDYLRQVLGDTLKQAFDASPYSRVLVKYETDPPPKTSLTWSISVLHSTIESEYAQWVATRTPPLFGHYPDAKVMDLARSLGEPAEFKILDVGAGTGRNTLPLARAGFRVDAMELAPALTTVLRDDIEKEGLAVRVFEGSILDGSVELPAEYYQMIFLAEVVPHFRSLEQVRTVFEKAARSLVQNGHLLFNAFIALDGYKPDDLARQMSEVMWCRIFTRNDIREATSGLPFECVSDESTLEYERTHHPPEQWPPTGWYEAWCVGQDAFDLAASKSPTEMRWLTYLKKS